MFLQPSLFHEFLDKSCLTEQIYEAMKKDDMAEVVMTALNILKKTNKIPSVITQGKSEKQSDILRAAGNEKLSIGDYAKALQHYNWALLCAPKNSRAMKLAYSNRSYILFKTKQFIACITDIDRCFSMGCPAEIKDKLLKRREEANKYAPMESLVYTTLKGFSNNYFNFTTDRNSIVPSVSAKVNIEINMDQSIVTAATEINAGTMISYEEAYMTSVIHRDCYNTCYHCLRIIPNLIPCDNCCYALFCSMECKKKCNEEYHKYECNMMALIDRICYGPIPNLLIKSVLKLKTKVSSWNEFIKASKKLGRERIKNSTVKDVFDVSSEYSVLSFNENRVFIHGIMYNASFVCATMLHYLSEIPEFLPNIDKEQALRALARIMMYLSVYGPPDHVIQVVTEIISDRTDIHRAQNFAWYTFYGNLKTSCKPNVVALFLLNKVALITIRKIEQGEEIVTSCFESTVTYDKHFNNIQRYLMRGRICTCSECKGDFRRDVLSTSQREYFEKVNIPALQAKFDVTYNKEIFDKVIKVMDVLSDVPKSIEYVDTYILFRKCLMLYEAVETNNYILRN